MSEQLLAVYCGTDSVARLGGDEFAVIIPNVRDANDLMVPTERFRDLLRDPREPDGKRLPISVSIGAALYPEHDRNAAGLLGNAEIALYRAKNAGRNRFVIFEPSMRDEVEQRVSLLAEIRSGIERGEFALYYQPLVRIAKPRAVTGFEALMRWQHPARGVLAPDQFLGRPGGSGALARARRGGAGPRDWRRCARGSMPGSSSGASPSICRPRSSAAAIWRGPSWPSCSARVCPRKRLTLEVTENVYMGWGSDDRRRHHQRPARGGNPDRARRLRHRLRVADESQTIPDRLSQDRSDRSFAICAIRRSCRRSLSLGAGMGMKVVAEGVEDVHQLDLLGAMGCDQVQGYYFARPMPATDVPTFLTTFGDSVAVEDQAAA